MQSPIDWKKVSAVFLDMDGTLLDLHFDNYFWHEYVPIKYSQMNKLELLHAKELLIQRYKEKAGTLDWYCTDYWSENLQLDIPALKREISHRIKIFPNVREFLSKLKQLDKRVVMVTNAHRDSVSIKMKHLNIHSYFDKIISSHDFGYPKEEAKFWKLLYQVEPHNTASTLFMDDNLTVMAAAEAHGIEHLITIKQPDTSKPMQDTLHYPAISNFSEIMPTEQSTL